MSKVTTLEIPGVLTAGDLKSPFGGVLVGVHVNNNREPATQIATDRFGWFCLALEAGRHFEFALLETLALSVSATRDSDPFYMSKPFSLARLTAQGIRLHVPTAALDNAGRKSAVRLLVDGRPALALEIGQTLGLSASGLHPSAPYEIVLAGENLDPLSQSLLSDSFGNIEPTTILAQFGFEDFESEHGLTLEEAIDRFQGRTLKWEMRLERETVVAGRLVVAGELTRPFAFVSDKEGRLQNAIQHGEQELFLTIANVPQTPEMVAYLVPRRTQWVVGESFQPARDENGRELALSFHTEGRFQTVHLGSAAHLPAGAYDILIRPVRYGFEIDQRHTLLATDIVVGQGHTGLVVREDFWLAKPVLGACVNAFPMSGSVVSGPPYFQYRDTFAVGEDVWAAMDPGIVPPGQMGKKIAFYVVNSKTAAQWNASSALTHVAPGSPLEVVLQSGCINANDRKVWPTANQIGTFDIVADFGNNDPNPAAFVADGSFDTPTDMIDGYYTPGFRVVDDPGTMTEWSFFGSINVDAALLAGLGIGANMTVEDENGTYSTPGGFTPVNETIPRLAIIRFPADFSGATQASQISAVNSDYPLVVVVHGNGHTYTNYAFLLEHLAQNGFIAASIHISSNLRGLARANAFFDHLNTIQTLFGSAVQDNVGVLGHSRGGEAVFKIARLNQDPGLGIGLNALMALGPTDQYGRESIGGAAARPLFVLYGAKDDDVSGWIGGSPSIRQSGFSLYDRFSNQDKSMAFVYDATHNGFVTHNEAFGAPPPPPLMTVANQQKILLAYANAFFRMNLQGESEWRGMFTGEWKPPQVNATGATMAFQFRDTTGRTMDNFEGPHNPNDWQTSSIGGAVTETGLPGDPVETQLFTNDNTSPHDTGGMRLVWNSAGDEVVFSVPAGQRDLSAFDFISVRIGQVVGGNPAGDQNLRVGLRDSGGNERLIRVSAFGRILEPAVANQASNTKSAMATMRIPLTAYTVVSAGAVSVDLTDVTEVKLVFSEKATGDIAIDELEFTV